MGPLDIGGVSNILSTIRFKTKNCGGIGGLENKRRELFDNLRHNNDVIVLTETKFKHSKEATYRQEWNSGMYNSCTTEDRAQAGVSILFGRGLDITILEKDHGSDSEGRMVWVKGELRSKIILFVGIYAPSDGDNHLFFEETVFPVLVNKNYDHVVICGDWNLGMDVDLDYKGYAPNSPKRPKCREAIIKYMHSCDLIDIYRELHPMGQDCSWRQWNKAQRRSTKEARLDFFLVDSNLASYVQAIGPSEPFVQSYDHKPVIMKIDFDKVTRGAGYWKFNNHMLKDLAFLQKVDEQIIWNIWQYQDPPADSEPLTLCEISLLSKSERAKVPLNINPHQFLEYTLFSIKGVARRHGQVKKATLLNQKREAEDSLEAAVKQQRELETLRVTQGYSRDLEVKMAEVFSSLSTLKSRVANIDQHLNEGAYIRTGYHWKCESESGTKIFLQQEKWRGTQRYIGILEVDEGVDQVPRILRNQPEIETEIRNFYSQLYAPHVTNSSREDISDFMGEGFSDFENIVQRNVPLHAQQKLDNVISEEELMQAIQHGKHGVAPGLSGFSREFFKFFAEDLIGFIMKYVDFSENTGSLSDNQRIGVITLIPKGAKDKKALKNWRPITLLSTLYKVISGVIANRFRTVLPKIIGLDQKGFVDGRYMGEVTRTLYDTIDDAYLNNKKGIILSVDFEKAFDSVSFSFMEKVIELAGFGPRLRKWVRILLSNFKSHINHAGNLLQLIELGRGARQGDPIASILFVLAIEILLVALRSNKKITPYTFHSNFRQQAISSKCEAYADDVNLTLPRSESSLREAVKMLEGFEAISGLKINKDKTQVLKIGRNPANDRNLCLDLGLKYVNRLKVLGIYLAADPKDMEENFDEKIGEIESLLRRWSFRNMTVFGRISLVKSLALSKLTHVVQVIPNPCAGKIKNLQKLINSFVWTGSHCKKVVVRGEISEQPMEQGGLAVPNISKFWNSLKLVWANRLIQSSDDCKWRQICLQQTGRALGKSYLTSAMLLQVGATTLADACSKRLPNVFWKNVWMNLPAVEKIFYSKIKYIQSEKLIWGSESIQFGGKPLDRRNFSRTITERFIKVSDFLDASSGLPMQENHPTFRDLSERDLSDWKSIMESVTEFLTANNMTWHHIGSQANFPQHVGWSRLVTNGTRSRFFYSLLQKYDAPVTRNSNESDWERAGLRNMTSARWDCVYRNFAALRTNFRVKFQEFRVIWNRQELQKYRLHYGRPGDNNDPDCSYCGGEVETEMHLYCECIVTEEFWKRAGQWFKSTFQVNPPLVLKVLRLFGQEKESPSDLMNIFYRSVRYCLYKNRRHTTGPSLDALAELVIDELDRKYQGERWKKYVDQPSEFIAITWLRAKKGWDHVRPTGLPLV